MLTKFEEKNVDPFLSYHVHKEISSGDIIKLHERRDFNQDQ